MRKRKRGPGAGVFRRVAAAKAVFPHGFLRGNKTLLAKAICPVFEYKPYGRQLYKLAELKLIGIVERVGMQRCCVYFEDAEKFKEAEANLSRLKKEKKAAGEERQAGCDTCESR